MKILVFNLLLFFTVNAQNIWYVDFQVVGGNNDGTSWTNAWKYPGTNRSGFPGAVTTGVDWSVIGDGDTIYVSGGTDSTNYYSDVATGMVFIGDANSGAERTFTTPPVVCPSWETGHNGDVYFTNYSATATRVLIVENVNNIKLVGFNVKNDYSGDITLLNAYDNDVEFDNWHFIGGVYHAACGFSGNRTIVKNCLFEHSYNNYTGDQDLIGVGNYGQNPAYGGIIFDHNTVIYRNGANTSSHRDMWQMGDAGTFEVDTLAEVVISNNLFIDTREEGNNWNAGIYSPSSECRMNVYIYNNILVSRKNAEDVTLIWVGMEQTEDYTDLLSKNSLFLFNNTIISKGTGSGVMMNNYVYDTCIVKNNLWISDATLDVFYNLDDATYWSACHKEFDYNYYAEYGGVSGDFALDRAIIKSFTTWQNDFSYDLNSITSNSTAVTFSNKYDTVATGYYTTAGRDLGTDLSSYETILPTGAPPLNIDILGNSRSGTWDIGALEYQESQSSNIIVKSKIFLQGPFNTNLMMTNLSQNGLLPNTQPFNTSPWNYKGSESLGSSSTSSYVDWVLVEIRSSSNPTQVVARQAAILNNDGTLLNPDGSTGVPFNNVQEGFYYVAVFHRSHLAIMSTNPVQLTVNSPVYDFTNAVNKAYGTDPMVNLGDGKFGMYAGDGNSNGGVTIADRNEIWAPQNGTMGYLNGDFNLDGGVTASDVNLYWNINNGTMTQVP